MDHFIAAELLAAQPRDQKLMVFAESLLDHRFNPQIDLALLAGWGHFDSIELVLERRADISATDIYHSFEKAAEQGCREVILFFLQRPLEIPQEIIRQAIETAQAKDHSQVTQTLMEHLGSL